MSRLRDATLNAPELHHQLVRIFGVFFPASLVWLGLVALFFIKNALLHQFFFTPMQLVLSGYGGCTYSVIDGGFRSPTIWRQVNAFAEFPTWSSLQSLFLTILRERTGPLASGQVPIGRSSRCCYLAQWILT